MVSVAIYTLNEELNLPHCLASLTNCDDIVVIDSYSSDSTCEIAAKAGARVFKHEFTGFGDQRNWSFDHIKFKYSWLVILDADERITPALWSEIVIRTQTAPESVAAFRLKRRFYWQGAWLKHANLYPSWVVRIVRPNKVRYINRGHSETQEVNGTINSLTEDLLDENRKNIDEWRKRQIDYARKEAEYESQSDELIYISELISGDPLVRRAALKLLGRRVPFRGFCYFIYSYILRNGWKDGLTGLKFCIEKANYQKTIRRFVTELRKSR